MFLIATINNIIVSDVNSTLDEQVDSVVEHLICTKPLISRYIGVCLYELHILVY